MSTDIGIAGLVAAIVVGLGFFVSMVSSFYRKCGPNQAMIISGMLAVDANGSSHKVVIGGGSTVFPVIQQYSYLSLECLSIALEPKTPYITKDGTQIKFRAVAQAKVKPDPCSVLMAAESFLNKSESENAERVKEIILSHTRSIVGTLSYAEILHDLHGLSQRVQEDSISSLAKFGMTIMSYSIDEMETDTAQLQSLVFDAAMRA